MRVPELHELILRLPEILFPGKATVSKFLRSMLTVLIFLTIVWYIYMWIVTKLA